MKKVIRSTVCAWAAGMLGWLGYSYLMWNKKTPSEEQIESYSRKLLSDIGMPELYGTWTEEVLPVTEGELRLYHFKADPEDPVMVFVPGTSVYALLYTEFMYKLSLQGFNVVGFDPRGHGKSTGKRGVYTLGSLVEDTRAVVNHAADLYNDKIAVSGSSQGGMVSFYCAAGEPRVKAAVCHNVLAPDEPDNERITRWPWMWRPLMPILPLFKPIMDSPLGQLMIPISLYLNLKVEKSRLVADVAKFIKEDPVMLDAVSFGAFYSLTTTPLGKKVEEIDTPVMVIHSGQDNIFPEDYVRRVYDRLTCEKEFVYLPDAQHLIVVDYVEELVPRVCSWVKRMVEKR
jgi:alpha-beta hydrolase superfamily lysophospholipase